MTFTINTGPNAWTPWGPGQNEQAFGQKAFDIHLQIKRVALWGHTWALPSETKVPGPAGTWTAAG